MDPYIRPVNLDEALSTLSDNPRTLLAGGTDFFPARVGGAVTEKVLDITGIKSLRYINSTDDYLIYIDG